MSTLSSYTNNLMLTIFPLYSKKDSEHDEEQIVVERFYGPPTSCNELGKLGYTLNGYYLVNGVNSKRQIEIILCQFKSPHGFNLGKLKHGVGIIIIVIIIIDHHHHPYSMVKASTLH